MNILILAIVLISIITISIAIKLSKKTEEKTEKDFWEREQEANFTRKKSLDDLDYITIPDSILALDDNVLSKLSSQKIVNLNGIPNTDLKLEYGAANITVLSEYDQNYSDLITRLSSIADEFITKANDNALSSTEKESAANTAVQILEFSTDIRSDIVKCWTDLAMLYISTNQKAKIHLLIKKAENVKTFRGPAILRHLNEILDNE